MIAKRIVLDDIINLESLIIANRLTIKIYKTYIKELEHSTNYNFFKTETERERYHLYKLIEDYKEHINDMKKEIKRLKKVSENLAG